MIDADYVVNYCYCTVMSRIYLSYSAAAILLAIKNGYHYGFDVMDILGLPSGTVYPALRRMEEAGLIEGSWEKSQVAHRDARPARKYYQLTHSGRNALNEAAGRYRLPDPLDAPASRPARERG
jgi:PadR family transcriptional regulator PadR